MKAWLNKNILDLVMSFSLIDEKLDQWATKIINHT